MAWTKKTTKTIVLNLPLYFTNHNHMNGHAPFKKKEKLKGKYVHEQKLFGTLNYMYTQKGT